MKQQNTLKNSKMYKIKLTHKLISNIINNVDDYKKINRWEKENGH